MADDIIEARKALGSAIAWRSEREGCVKTAEAAKSRACALIREKRASLTRLASDERCAAEAQAAALRSGKYDAPTVAPQVRAQAQVEFQQAQAAMDILIAELAASKAIFQASEAAVHEAVARLISLEADSLADELVVHYERATAIRHALQGLSYVGSLRTGDFRPWPLSSKLRAALDWIEPQRPGHINPIRDATVCWAKYRDALINDPEAASGIILKWLGPALKEVA